MSDEEYKYDKSKMYEFHVGASNDDFRNSQVFVIDAHTSKEACDMVKRKGDFQQFRVLMRVDKA